MADLPCDGEGVCMVCKIKPSPNETLTCKTCVTPWHATCLSDPLQTLAAAVQWECPDCSSISAAPDSGTAAAPAAGSQSGIVVAVRAIESDPTLTDQEKARRRQELLSGGAAGGDDDVEKAKSGGVLETLDESMICSCCRQLPDRPVTTPCGHNFCLKCFQKWISLGKRSCANCRTEIPPKMASQPRINSTLVVAIRTAKLSNANTSSGPPKPYHHVQNQDRPDKCYTTERAKKTGKANACSGKIFVTVPPDHFGPILEENDPERNQGVLVGETWEDRMECRQWGAHLPHVAGIAGQSDYGAQSVALSGGYEDDEDHGEWFLYTGSGGRDLSGNKRTNKKQSFDQKFDKSNEALRQSCRQGYPVRVVRSFKEKRSSYAPETGVRYDGIYRIEKCWRKTGIQGFKVCRYLFVRCDNAPAPWTSDLQGDRPRPLPIIKELKDATDITERKVAASWDFDEEKGSWIWKRDPPASRKQIDENGKPSQNRRNKRVITIQERLLKGFGCLICKKVMSQPITTPCAHNFCKGCLEGAFAGKAFIRQTNCEGRRSLRARKNVMKCPSCTNDISDFLQNPQVNRELMSMIESLQQQIKEAETKDSNEDVDTADGKSESVSVEDEDLEDEGDDNPEEDEQDDEEENNQNPENIPVVNEDGKKSNIQDSPTKITSAGMVTSKRKRDAGEKENVLTDNVKIKTNNKRKISAAVKEESNVEEVEGGGKRRSKRQNANE